MSEGDKVEVTLLTPETFPFPYPTPYGIQVDLMRTVFEAIEQKKIAIVSPDPDHHHPSQMRPDIDQWQGRITDGYGKESDTLDFDFDVVAAKSKTSGRRG